MANDFVRNIKGVRNIDILSPNITTENDLISTTDGDVYVVTNKGYKKITGIETDVSNLKIQSDTNTLTISDNTDDIETNTSEIETLKTTNNNYKVLLYDGSASITGELITLNQSYKDFKELKIKIARVGGNEIFNFDGEDDGTIPINHTNVFNSGSGYSVNEMLIIRNSPTELEINSQAYFDSNGTSNNESEITILKIWGVK